MLPSCLVACEKLVELKLSGGIIRLDPSSLHCGNLKVLSLAYVEFADCGSLEDFLRDCPALEELYMEGCYIKSDYSFDVCLSSSLKILQYTGGPYVYDASITIDTPNLLQLQVRQAELVELRAPSTLRHLKLEEFVISDGFHMEEMPCWSKNRFGG